MKKTVLSISMVAALAFALPTNVFSAGYGTAGCGLGAIVIGPKPGIIQVIAATTNGTSYSQTFGITTGTSECKDGAKAQVEQKVYAYSNFEGLQKEIAQGKGEKVTSLAYPMGCSADSVDTFASLTKSNYSSIFSGEKVTSDVMLNRIRTIASNDKSLSTSCKAIY